MAAVLMGLGSKTPSSGWSMAATGGLAGRQEPRDASGIDELPRVGYAGDGRRRGLQPSAHFFFFLSSSAHFLGGDSAADLRASESDGESRPVGRPGRKEMAPCKQ